MQFQGTTIIGVKRNGKTVIGGDGQVTMGETVFKGNARKVRRIGEGKVISGFAGSVADALALYERFETKYKSSNGNLVKAAVELTKEWRMDKVLRRLEALLLVADKDNMLLISGMARNGTSRRCYSYWFWRSICYAAALALLRNTELDAEEIVQKSLHIAGQICIYTNENISLEIIE